MMNLGMEHGIAVLHVSGLLAKSDYAEVLPQLEHQIESQDKPRVIVVLDGFHGWTPSGLLEELRFDVRHREDLEKVAVVGEPALEEIGTKITRAFFSGEVRYFDKQRRAEAERWIQS